MAYRYLYRPPACSRSKPGVILALVKLWEAGPKVLERGGAQHQLVNFVNPLPQCLPVRGCP